MVGADWTAGAGVLRERLGGANSAMRPRSRRTSYLIPRNRPATWAERPAGVEKLRTQNTPAVAPSSSDTAHKTVKSRRIG